MSAGQLLEVLDLNVAIGATRIVKGVSLDVRAGEILGLVGASGSGKSMTALSIMRLLPPKASLAGITRLNGETLNLKSEAQMRSIRGRDIGMVFQEPMSALNPLMRIGDQVAETVRSHRETSEKEAQSLARETLNSVGLQGEQGALHRLPYELSGGQRQRVAIAMAMVLSPQFLIADEPTTALDVVTQAQVLRLLQEWVRTRNMGMILVTHDLAVIAQLADRVAVMHRGEIVEQASTAEILSRPRSAYTAALLAASELQPKRSAMREGSSPAVLQVQGVVREYPRKRTSLWHSPTPLRAVDGVSLSVHAGETVGLVGESGSGKSSLLRVILALERSQAGEVSLLGETLSHATGATLSRLRRSIQVVFQDPYGSFDPRWTVEQLIGEPFFLLSSPPSNVERRRKVARVLEQVGLSAADAQRLPWEFFGRRAPADRDCTRTDHGARGDRIRRSCFRPRRADPRAGSPASRRSRRAPQGGVSVRVARFTRDQGHCGSCLCDAAGANRRGGSGGCRVRLAAPRLHPSVDCRLPEAPCEREPVRGSWVRAPRLAAARLIRRNRRSRAGVKTLAVLFGLGVLFILFWAEAMTAPPLKWLRLHGLLCAGLAAVGSAVMIARRRALKRAEFARSWLAAVPVGAWTARWESLLIETLPAIAVIGSLGFAAISDALVLALKGSIDVVAPFAVWGMFSGGIAAGVIGSFLIPQPKPADLPPGSRYVPHRKTNRAAIIRPSLGALGTGRFVKRLPGRNPKSSRAQLFHCWS